jgi:hypothetical protein
MTRRKPPVPGKNRCSKVVPITGNTGKWNERREGGGWELSSGIRSVEPRHPAVGISQPRKWCKGEMTHEPISLQDLRGRICYKAKADKTWRFWELYVHPGKTETLNTPYKLARENDGAAGGYGATFEGIEENGWRGYVTKLPPAPIGPPETGKRRCQKAGGQTSNLRHYDGCFILHLPQLGNATLSVGV